MEVSSKRIKRALRDLDTIVSDLINANSDNYLPMVKRFTSFIYDDEIINKLVQPLLQSDLTINEFIIDHGNGWGTIKIPQKTKDHISFVLKLFNRFSTDPEQDIVSFAFDHFPNNYGKYDYSLREFNDQIIRPALKALITKIEDFIEDEVSDKESLDFSLVRIYSIGNIIANGSNVAIGKNIRINQKMDLARFREDIIKELITKGLNLAEIDQIRPEVESIDSEIKKPGMDNSKIKAACAKIKSLSGAIAEKVIIEYLTKPETIAAIGKIFS
jgi:hypothetical protein